MKVNEQCAECLYDKQIHKTDDPDYLAEVRSILENRKEDDSAPYLVYLFTKAYERHFGNSEPYRELRKTYNVFVLSMEDEIRRRIEAKPDALAAALAYARIGNYIDFGAMNSIDTDTFLSLLESAAIEERDRAAYEHFTSSCEIGKKFLLIADNCGEIVLDKLFLEQLHKKYPRLELSVLVRGAEVLNDVTPEDALYIHLDDLAKIISSGSSIAGTVYNMLTDEAKLAIDCSDVILSKGQGNYECLCGENRHIFYSLLCKCDLFMERFHVPRYTGIFIEEQNGQSDFSCIQ